jgi:hypothetical protein
VAIGSLLASSICRSNKSLRQRLRIDKCHKPGQMPRHLLHRLGVMGTREKSRRVVKALKKEGLITRKRRFVCLPELADDEFFKRMDIVQERCNFDHGQVRRIVETLKLVGVERTSYQQML